jgi:uncharacterized protein YfiM (DUF2279 family)
MKAFVVTIIIIFSICFAQSAEADSLNTPHRTIGIDKIQHVAFSCLWTLSSQYVMVNKSGFNERKALSYSVSSSALIGLAKELNDWQTKERPFDWGDLIADGVGIAIAVFIIIQ